jgi:transcriptional regulator with XRE-family HTH domain
MAHPRKGYLRSIRQDAGLTQTALAALIATSPTTLSAYETGARPVPPEMVATIEAACFPLSPPPAPSLNTPHHAPPGVEEVPSPDQADAPLVVVDQREPPYTLAPMTYSATYSVTQLEVLKMAYVSCVDADNETSLRLHETLDGFLLFLERDEAETRAAQAFAAACATLIQTGAVAAYTAAVLEAQQAGLPPSRMAAVLREAFQSPDAPAVTTLLHEGNAPWLCEQGDAHVSG